MSIGVYLKMILHWATSKMMAKWRSGWSPWSHEKRLDLMRRLSL